MEATIGQPTPSFRGRRIALLESRRRRELAQLIESYGGIAYAAPALREDPIADSDQINTLLDTFREKPLTVAVFQTGVGARVLFETIREAGRWDEWRALLASALVVARGPKPIAVLREAGVAIDRRAPEPYTTADVMHVLAGENLDGAVVAVQQYGEPNLALSHYLRERGARVVEIDVYRWALPDDLSPLENLLRDLPTGTIDAVVATSQIQVHHLFQVAARQGLAEALPIWLSQSTVVAAVGPVVARAFESHGVRVDLQPHSPKMGRLVLDLAAFLERSNPASPR